MLTATPPAPTIKWPDGTLPANDRAVCNNCRQPKRDLMRTLDPRTRAKVIDLCGGCASTLARTAEITRILRSELEDVAVAWARGEDDYGAAGRLLRETGQPLNLRWSLFKELVAAVAFRQAVTDGDITTGEVEPELAHPDVLAEAAQQQVDDALAELVGGTR